MSIENAARTFVITGGTSGIGRGLARYYLGNGDRVIAIGHDNANGEAFMTEAARIGAAERASYLPADLSLVRENRRVIAELTARHQTVDALVLGARYYRSNRVATTEGIEHNFALFYLSRYLLSNGLAPLMATAHRPVILDLAGPGTELSLMNFADPQFSNRYTPESVMAQCGKLSDLNGVNFTAAHPKSPIHYVIAHPGLTATAFAGQYNRADHELVTAMRHRGQPITEALPLLRRHLDEPDPESFSAYMQHTKIDVTSPNFDPHAARRLADYTATVLARVP